LSRIYSDLNQIILNGTIDRQKLDSLVKDASNFPSEWLLHSEINNYMSTLEIV